MAGTCSFTIAAGVIAVAVATAVGGCASPAPAGSHPAALPDNAIGNNDMQFDTNRKPVLAAGSECSGFTAKVRAAAAVADKTAATPMEPGHGCWAADGHDGMVSIVTTATAFGKFWRRGYPDDDGSGLTASIVDAGTAQSFERFVLDHRYYGVRAGSQWTAGLSSGLTKTACMVVVDTGSAQPLLVDLTQQVPHGDPATGTVAGLCATTEQVARAVLDEQDPGGGSRVP
ncbi:hypothetical protein [Nocardia sp. alder85J]|uniref:hypothetical protein n=1 Tax=Nocardia sp. alder85J TaxID=2862949 RepID=UPI001CD4CA49|nr:hypothetical protein [Nocardia sp. alder85J]MCX4092394.1 hypothetical protein [Nocardia sp. alder85J]